MACNIISVENDKAVKTQIMIENLPKKDPVNWRKATFATVKFPPSQQH